MKIDEIIIPKYKNGTIKAIGLHRIIRIILDKTRVQLWTSCKNPRETWHRMTWDQQETWLNNCYPTVDEPFIGEKVRKYLFYSKNFVKNYIREKIDADIDSDKEEENTFIAIDNFVLKLKEKGLV